jgi:uncharacterized membrane protein YtjA (UPF0391 family)
MARTNGTSIRTARLLNKFNDEGSEATAMLKWAIIFFLISIVAGGLGYSGIAAGAAGIAKILFALFLILAIIFVILLLTGVSVMT